MLRLSLILTFASFVSACSASDTTGASGVPDAGGTGLFATQIPDAGSPGDDPQEPDTAGPGVEDAGGSSVTDDVDEAPATCEEGKACNDGDLCTKNDVCTAGVCAGEATGDGCAGVLRNSNCRLTG